MELLKVEFISSNNTTIFCYVTYKTFWLQRIIKREVYMKQERYLKDEWYSPMYSNTDRLAGFETFIGLNVSNSINKAIKIHMLRIYNEDLKAIDLRGNTITINNKL